MLDVVFVLIRSVLRRQPWLHRRLSMGSGEVAVVARLRHQLIVFMCFLGLQHCPCSKIPEKFCHDCQRVASMDLSAFLRLHHATARRCMTQVFDGITTWLDLLRR